MRDVKGCFEHIIGWRAERSPTRYASSAPRPIADCYKILMVDYDATCETTMATTITMKS
ncbi:unnamed protein product [Musa textilis]